MMMRSASATRRERDIDVEFSDDYRDEPYELEAENGVSAPSARLIIAALYRNRLVVLGVVTAALLAGIILTVLTTPIYQASASVQIEQQKATLLENSELEPVAPIADADRFLQTQASILRSRALAHRVAQSLGLYRDDNFIVAMGEAPPQASGRHLAAERQRVVIDILLDNLDISVPRQSRVVTISFQSPDPAIAARVANSFADNFIQSNLDRRVDSSAYARQFLMSQITETKERLEDSEQALLTYARQAGLIDAGGGEAQDKASQSLTLPASNLRDINAAYARTRAARVEAEQRWRSAQSTPLMSLPEVISSPIILPLIQQRATHIAALGELRARYRADHPTVVQLERQLGNVDLEIEKQAVNIRNSIRNAYLILREQENALAANVEDLRTSALDEQSRRVRYNILKREVDTNRTVYDALLQRYKELAATAGASINNVSIVDSAELPQYPNKPRLLVNLALALIAGLGLAGLVTFLRERLDDVVRTPDEVQAKLGLPLLGAIPRVPKDSTPSEEILDAQSPMSEAYHSLRTAIGFATPEGAQHTILFTSSQPSEGKSTSSVAIAQSFGRLGRKVLLIDSDLRKPSLHKHLQRSARSGLVDLLTGQKTFFDVIQASAMPGVDFIASGPLPPNPTDLLSSEALPRLLAQARAEYDVVVVDGPPVIGLADAPLLARHMDAVGFVIETGRAHRGQAKAAIRRLAVARANIIGVILTKFDAARSGYGYGYGYGYSYGQKAGE